MGPSGGFVAISLPIIIPRFEHLEIYSGFIYSGSGAIVTSFSWKRVAEASGKDNNMFFSWLEMYGMQYFVGAYPLTGTLSGMRTTFWYSV